MKNSSHAPSATSLPRAPRDDVDARSTRYLITMGIRILCFILMVVITPYGWYTWVFGAAAIFLPYIAVVSANVGQEGRRNRREDPEPALPSAPSPSVATPPAPETRVIRIQESPALPSDAPARSESTDPTDDETPDRTA
ncbi:DUF3099 domain-containing protein [Microbacterium ureisolvens]|uniref:DUF3099 domain-containing protein n=1 Tax=Microbacterium ureisolvens TaxID=2781186 RepID=UPI0036328646